MKHSERLSALTSGRTRLLSFVGAACLASGLAGFGASALAQAPSTVRIVLQSQLRILDPVLTVAYSTRNHGYLVYDTLFSMDAKSMPQPQMVDTFTVSPDKLTYSFTLRKIKFHDGTPVTSEDVIASLKRWSSRDQMGVRLFAALQEMKAVDAQTFTIKLKEPFGLVLETLAKQSSPVPFIMPPRQCAPA
ncbi:MAG: hypothetical protein EOP39_26940 [Rubrivivax sp.]|nr:MAG: hypothetical protein EOP39_26940 [Rubrivivax sp.]